MSDAAKEPLTGTVMKKPTESTPLVPTTTEESRSNNQAEQTKIAFASTFLISIAVCKTQLTAYMFNTLDYPTAYSLYSCIVTILLLMPIFLLDGRIPGMSKQWGVPVMAMFLKPPEARSHALDVVGPFSLIVIFTAFDLGFTNIALANISTALQQCIAATNPFWCLMIETVLFRRRQHLVIYLAVSFVVIGAVLVSVSQVNTLDTFGLLAACVAVLCSASKYAFTHQTFKTFKGVLGPNALLFWIDLLMVPIYILWIAIGDGLGATHELGILKSGAFTDAVVFWQFTGTAGLGGVRAVSQFVMLFFVSATSMSLANIFTQILNILISMGLQPDKVDMNPELVVGILVVTSSVFTYTFLKTNNNSCWP